MRLATRVLLVGLVAGIVPAVPANADHDYRGCDPYYEDCRGDEYDQWDSDQRSHNRRNRGSFSPGPFQDSPVTIIICPPGTQYCGSDGGRSDASPPE